MKKVAETALVVLVTFMVTLIIQTVVNYLASPDLEILMGPRVVIDSQIYQCVDLTNMSDKSLDNLKLSIPQSIRIDKIISSNPISIREIGTNTNDAFSKAVEISNIKASEMTELLLPLKNLDQAVEIISYKDVKKGSYDNIKNPIEQALWKGLVSASVYSIILGIFSFFLFTQIESANQQRIQAGKELDEQLDKNKSKLEQTKKEFDEELQRTKLNLEESKKESKAEIDEMHRTLARYKALEGLRIIDYQKELNFWRNMIRELLFDSVRKTFKDADQIIEKITQELKTFSTREKTTLDLDTAMHYASWANEK